MSQCHTSYLQRLNFLIFHSRNFYTYKFSNNASIFCCLPCVKKQLPVMLGTGYLKNITDFRYSMHSSSVKILKNYRHINYFGTKITEKWEQIATFITLSYNQTHPNYETRCQRSNHASDSICITCL